MRARYGVCVHAGSMSRVALGEVCLWWCELYSACSSAFVRQSGLCSGRDSDMPPHAVKVFMPAENMESKGPCV